MVQDKISIKKILIIIQRSNGDVFLSGSLIEQLKKNLNLECIDLLVNDDTLLVAETLPYVNEIITFSYKQKKQNRWLQEKKIIKSIYKKYDVSINLTASDRSVLYAIFASKFAISAIEKNNSKSWWKIFFLKHHYIFDSNQHILQNNLESLKFFGINPSFKLFEPLVLSQAKISIKEKLSQLNIKRFLILHPSAQYDYKIYPQNLRNKLIEMLNQLDIPIIVTGSQNQIDLNISESIPNLNNIFNWMGKTSIDEYFALSALSDGYIGMDTLNMHIAASQNKRIFAIFGPTILKMWSPWSNKSEKSATTNIPLQNYGKVTIFQANMACVACGKAGCDDNHGRSECLHNINPTDIYKEIKSWLSNV